MTFTRPRVVKPETICVGDTINVRFPEDGGITTFKQGTVESITAEASLRSFRTADGNAIGVYAPGSDSKLTFTLMARREHPQTEMELSWEH